MPKTFFDMGKNLSKDKFETIHIEPSKYTIGIDFSTVEEIKARNMAANAAVDRAMQRVREQMNSAFSDFTSYSAIFDGGTRIREPFIYSSRNPDGPKPDGNVIDLSPEDYREVKEVRELPEVTGEDKPI